LRDKVCILGLGLLVAVSMVAGCTDSTGGNPSGTGETPTGPASTSSASSVSGTAPSNDAPKVTNPLNVDKFTQQPCGMLTSEQIKELLGEPLSGKAEQGEAGPSCQWLNSDTGAQVIGAILTSAQGGLNAVYKLRDTYKFFTEYPSLAGYPGVAVGTIDGRADGRCNVFVGVSDKLAFSVGLVLSRAKRGQKDPCEVAKIAAEMAVQTMKKGGS
jgi:hypothetical protein